MKSTTTRTLTHKLTCDKRTLRWSCKCGYVLGTGHEALYAQCPLAPKPHSKAMRGMLMVDGKCTPFEMEGRPEPDDGYIEFDISTPTHEKKPPKTATPKRQVGRRVARIHRQGPDLFQ
jgi:hypothetical protein